MYYRYLQFKFFPVKMNISDIHNVALPETNDGVNNQTFFYPAATLVLCLYLDLFPSIPIISTTTAGPASPPPCAPDPRPSGVFAAACDGAVPAWCCSSLCPSLSQARARLCANMLPFLIQTVCKALGQNILSP